MAPTGEVSKPPGRWDMNRMLTKPQLALCQADAIARLARLRVCATAQVTALGHLSLELHSGPELPVSQREWIDQTLGPYGSNVVRVVLWEQRHSTPAQQG